MRIADLFKRKSAASMRVEPKTPLNADPSPNERYRARNTIDALLADEKYDAQEKPEDADLLFDLIGTRLGADRHARVPLADGYQAGALAYRKARRMPGRRCPPEDRRRVRVG
jgi:hypothetical protein